MIIPYIYVNVACYMDVFYHFTICHYHLSDVEKFTGIYSRIFLIIAFMWCTWEFPHPWTVYINIFCVYMLCIYCVYMLYILLCMLILIKSTNTAMSTHTVKQTFHINCLINKSQTLEISVRKAQFNMFNEMYIYSN